MSQKASETQSVTSYKTPKNTLLVVTKAGVAKGLSEWWQLLTLGWHAGIFIGIAGGLAVAIAGALDTSVSGTMPVYDGSVVDPSGEISLKISAPSGVKKFVNGALFPLGLILVVLSGAELFTGNIMYLLAARLGNQTTWRNLIKNWTMAYFGNLCGCLAVAYFLFHLTELFDTPYHEAYLHSIAKSKCQDGNWGMYFLKGVGANYLVCISLWCANSADDVFSKIVAIWWPVMGFICCGFEHSIANMFFVPMAIMNDATDVTTNEFIVRNLIPATLGNMAGGAIFICTQYLIYHPYALPAIQDMTIKQGGAEVTVVDGKHVVPQSRDKIGHYVSHAIDYLLCRLSGNNNTNNTSDGNVKKGASNDNIDLEGNRGEVEVAAPMNEKSAV